MVAELRAGIHTRTDLHAQSIEKQGERSAGKAVFGRKLEIRFGGASRDRTDGLVVANDALSQLSYSPTLVLDGLDHFISASIVSTTGRATEMSTPYRHLARTSTTINKKCAYNSSEAG